MKKLVSIVLAVTIISQNLVYAGIGVYYHLNKTYIGQKLCENRNNPALHCNGRCYLSKQLKKAETGESKSAQIIKGRKVLMINECLKQCFAYFPICSRYVPPAFDTLLYTSDDINNIIKPPVTVPPLNRGYYRKPATV